MGRTGNAYALPTKDDKLKSLSLKEIQKHFRVFLRYAWERPDVKFILTPFGTGLAGYSVDEIRDIVNNERIPYNVVFHEEWNKNDRKMKNES